MTTTKADEPSASSATVVAFTLRLPTDLVAKLDGEIEAHRAEHGFAPSRSDIIVKILKRHFERRAK